MPISSANRCGCRWPAGSFRSSPTNTPTPRPGSGAVKITPAHDFNDFEVGRRHGLALLNIFDRGRAAERRRRRQPIAASTGSRRASKVVADLEAAGLIEKVEDHTLMVPHHDRSGEVIEPWLTDQWFCNAGVLAKPAIGAVEDGRTRFVPRQWENTFFDWMRNIQPWCISRQLWWGHQIPAWYGPDGAVFVAETEEEAQREAAAQIRRSGRAAPRRGCARHLVLVGAVAVLDARLARADPRARALLSGDVLVTGFDIIFFWVARMMMMGLHFMGDVPFRTVYIHALVRDERGQKMSKSRGNIIDPLELIDRYGCDALRFTLAALAAPGRDIKLAESRVEGYRNFATKLWNAARYAEMNGCTLAAGFRSGEMPADRQPLDRWRRLRLRRRGDGGSRRLSLRRGGEPLYQFVWGTFCDWYHRVHQADPAGRGRGGAGRDAGHDRLGPGRDRPPAAPDHAVHHRGDVGAPGGRRGRSAADRVMARFCGQSSSIPPRRPRWNGSSRRSRRSVRSAPR